MISKYEQTIKKLISGNLRLSFSDVLSGNKQNAIIPFGIGFISIDYNDEDHNQEYVVNALYNQIMNHEGYPIEKPIVLSKECEEDLIITHMRMQESLLKDYPRCSFLAFRSKKSFFESQSITIRLNNFYECLSDSVNSPLEVSTLVNRNWGMDGEGYNDARALQMANDAMNHIRSTLINQAEMFFKEFYHYNIEEMKNEYKKCLEVRND